MVEQGHKSRACRSLLESCSCSIEDEEHGEVWDSFTAAGYSFSSRWLGLIIRIEMPTACFPLSPGTCGKQAHNIRTIATNYNGVPIVPHPEEEENQ